MPNQLLKSISSAFLLVMISIIRGDQGLALAAKFPEMADCSATIFSSRTSDRKTNISRPSGNIYYTWETVTLWSCSAGLTPNCAIAIGSSFEYRTGSTGSWNPSGNGEACVSSSGDCGKNYQTTSLTTFPSSGTLTQGTYYRVGFGEIMMDPSLLGDCADYTLDYYGSTVFQGEP